MVRIMLFFTGIIASLTIVAQNSDYFNYQAVVRDASGNVKANANVTIGIDIIQGSVTGTVVFNETHSSTTNAFGLILLKIGSENTTSFASIDWTNAPYFIRVSVDGNVIGTNQLLSVPFALHAKTAETYSENDPIFSAHPAKGLSSNAISNWNTAYGWGNHALAGYLTSFTENDPIFNASAAHGITATNISNWNTAYGWGNHALAGYLTSFTENDPIFNVSAAHGITATNISNWNTAYGWGNHVGLYKSISYLPDWNEITNKPFNLSSPLNDQLLKYNSTSSKWENWTPNFLTSEIDGSVTNEIQTLTLNTNQLTISQSGGNTVTFSNWDTNSTDDVTTLAPPVNGDMLYYNGAAWTPIPKGTTGQILTMNSSGVPEWQSTLAAPIASTQAVTFSLPTTILNGTVNAGKLPTNVTFEYGTTTSYGNTVVATQSPITGIVNTNVSYNITSGLIAGTTYHVRVVAENALGKVYGDDMTFDYLAIGINWQGGIIFYLDNSGKHGLVAAHSDQSTSAEWGCLGTSISRADGTIVGTGNENTINIESTCTTAGTAADICSNLSLNTYDDWFLPSIDELGLIYTRLKLSGLGNLGAVNYWSSSEIDSNNAKKQNLGTGSQGSNTKDALYYVRAVRAF